MDGEQLSSMANSAVDEFEKRMGRSVYGRGSLVVVLEGLIKQAIREERARCVTRADNTIRTQLYGLTPAMMDKVRREVRAAMVED